jgi:hypothetical protein
MKRHFDYEAHDDQILTQRRKSKLKFSTRCLILMSCQFKKHSKKSINTWEPGAPAQSYQVTEKEELIERCSDLQLALTFGSDADIETAPPCDALISLKCSVKKLRIVSRCAKRIYRRHFGTACGSQLHWSSEHSCSFDQ